jgi:predicted phage baseplate assembly protein
MPFHVDSTNRAAANVFSVDAEAGIIHFGDGIHGARPPFQATMRADYAYCSGQSGNVSAGMINSSSVLPPGFKVSNPVQTWGGANAEAVEEGEKQIAHFLQHRDRLVSLADYATLAMRTPGVNIGRVEVLSAYNPDLTQNEPGDAPGAVTLMVIPKDDPVNPGAPMPDRLFLDTISSYLDPRRLITTEVFLRGPTYKPIWVSIGIRVVPGASIVQVREAVKAAIEQYLTPLPADPSTAQGDQLSVLHHVLNPAGWPLRKAVVDLELLAVATRIEGVLLVSNVLLAQGDNPGMRQVPMQGLELPYLAGLAVNVGDPYNLEQLRGQSLFDDRGGPGQPSGLNGSGSGGNGSATGTDGQPGPVSPGRNGNI